MPLYTESDFVDVVDENDKPLPDPVPKQWIGTELLPAGVKKACKKTAEKKTESKPADKPVEIPDGAPVEEWTNAQLDAYAAKQDPAVDVSKASNKAEKVALLTPPPAE